MRRVTRREFGSLAVWLFRGRADAAVRARNRADGPIRIGYTLPLSGGLAGNGKPAALAHRLWLEDINAKGGLLGRKVELVNYDDQSNPAQIPALYTKLLDVDKVDLVVSSYATALIAPAMPVIMAHGFGLRHFARLGRRTTHSTMIARSNISPTGGNMQEDFAKGFFEVAMTAEPKPKTVAIAGLDSDFLQRSMHERAHPGQGSRLEIVYDKSYPPATVDYSADRPRDPGGQTGHRLFRLLSAGFGRSAEARSTKPSSPRPCSAAA